MDALEREYAEAWDQMDDNQREQLKAAGINGPEPMSYRTYRPDYHPELLETQTVEPFECEGEESIYLAGLRRLIGELLADPNPRLSIECLSLVSGVCYTGDSMTEIAKRHGVGRAAVSKRCVAWADMLGLEPARAMKRADAREVYRKRTLKQHARNRQPDLFGEVQTVPATAFSGTNIQPAINKLLMLVVRRPLADLPAHELCDLHADLRPVRELIGEVDRLMEKESI